MLVARTGEYVRTSERERRRSVRYREIVVESFVRDLMTEAVALESHRAMRGWVLARLARDFGYDSAVYVSVSTPNDPPAAINRPDYRRHYARYLERPARYQPDLAKGHAAAERNGGAYVDTDVYTSRERDRLPFYRDIVRPQGTTSQLVARVSFQERSLGAIHLCRHGASRAFESDEASRVLPLLPAIALAQAAFELRSYAPAMPANGVARARLGVRELEIALLVAHGMKNRDIAVALGISPNTVRNQIASAFRKLGVRTRTELARRLRDVE